MLRILPLFLVFLCTSSCRIAFADFIIGGDTIGLDNSPVDGNGGSSAQSLLTFNAGLPGIQVSLDGDTRLTHLRAIVFATEGGPPPLDDIDFTEYSWTARLFHLDTYLAGGSPEFSAVIGQPYNATFQAVGDDVLPAAVFATGGSNIAGVDLYDFRWDLSTVTAFDAALAQDDWVFALQSENNSIDGIPGVVTSDVLTPPGVWSSDDFGFPQGYAFGTPPATTRTWAITLSGLSVSTVPEPSAIVYFIAALPVLLGRTWRKRVR